MSVREEMPSIYPRKFLATGWHAGFKPNPQLFDFGFIYSSLPCTGSALFTRSNLPSHAVVVGKEHAASSRLRAAIVNSGNANVANGRDGEALVRESCRLAAESLGIDPDQVLPASTGIIGRKMPEGILEQACREIKQKIKNLNSLAIPDFASFADAICTTDAFPKLISRQLPDGIRITAVAKGAGMIAPNMATMLVYICTDAKIAQQDSFRLLSAIVERSFNRISVDSDTSTSDTALLLANGASKVEVCFPAASAQAWAEITTTELIQAACSINPAAAAVASDAADAVSASNPVDAANAIDALCERLHLDISSTSFLLALFDICVELGRLIVKDGEGASRMIELRVEEARSPKQALLIAKAVIDSPLIKSALGGKSPRGELLWGRLLMAIGKAGIGSDELPSLAMDRLRILLENYPFSLDNPFDSHIADRLLKKENVLIRILLGQGDAAETVWGSSLTEDYVRLNSTYIT